MPPRLLLGEVGRQAAHREELRRRRGAIGNEEVARRAARDREPDRGVAQARCARTSGARAASTRQPGPGGGRRELRGRRRPGAAGAPRPRTARRRRCATCRRARRRAAGRDRAPRAWRRVRGGSDRSARRAPVQLLLRVSRPGRGGCAAVLSHASASSRSGSESATMPPPACQRTWPSATTAVRIGRPSSRSSRCDETERAGVDPARGRLQLGDDLHRAHLRRAGDRPAGKRRREQRADVDAVAQRPGDDARRDGAGVGWLSTRASASTRTLPGTHTRPRSLRSRSTIMTCSARSLGSRHSSAASAASPAGIGPRAVACP